MVNKKVRRRGRPPGGGRDSHAAIFAAAAREFAEHGYAPAGVDRIAARARVNKAMIYYHFGSKLGLYHEVLRDMFLAVGARARAIADAPGDAMGRLDDWIAAVAEEAGARPWFPSIMLHEIASGAPHLDADTLALMNGVFGAVQRMIEQGRRDGAFRDVDPLLTHLTIMPAILAFFARQRAIATRRGRRGVAAPRGVDAFVAHMQAAVRGMLRPSA